MGSWFTYWWIVVKRAWLRAWAATIQSSWKVLLRDALVTTATVGFLYASIGPLERSHFLQQGDSSVPDAVVWISVAAISAVALFGLLFLAEALFITPFILWREQQTSLKDISGRLAAFEGGDGTPRRIPILELLRAAEADGWAFSGSRNILYAFSQVVRQEAADGTIQIQGRERNRRNDFKWSLRNRMLMPILSEYFGEHWIMLHSAWLPPGDNTLSRASDILDQEPSYFIDLHVMNPAAYAWLYGDGRIARDVALQADADEKARVAANPIRQDEGDEI